MGSIGIFYTHYYSVLLLVGLGLWHLLFMPKDRRWWRPVLLLGLAGLAFLPELGGFLTGINWTQTKGWHTLASEMLRTAEVLPWFLYVLTNGLLRLPGVRLPVAPNIVALACIDAVCGVWLVALPAARVVSPATVPAIHHPGGVALDAGSINEILLVMRDDSLRYLMALWPMSALLIGWGVWRARGRWRLIAGSLTVSFSHLRPLGEYRCR